MKTGRGWWALVGIVFGSFEVLLGVYVGAYYTLVSAAPPIYPERQPLYEVPPTNHTWMLDSLFEPIHRIDRKLRPDYWYFDGEYDSGPDESDDLAEDSGQPSSQ
jgi:hypothetical protein